MKSIEIIPKKLKGEISIPPSKSVSHRAIIAAGLSQGTSIIDNILFSQDILATCKAMEALGANIEYGPQSIKITGSPSLDVTTGEIDCFESGSTLRFLIPLVALTGKEMTLKGRGKLVSRPIDTYYTIFENQNLEYAPTDGGLPLKIQGRLKAGEYSLRGDISSQFITGLLFALPLLKEDSKIILTNHLESKGYVDLTLDILDDFGIKIENKNYKEFIIKGNQRYQSRDFSIEGDFSQAAFWIVGGLLGEEIESKSIRMDSLQGDKAILSIVEKMGGELVYDSKSIKALASKTKGITIDASQCPDLVPILAVLGALSEGTTKIINAKRLRIKESDRLKAISTELNKIGAQIEELEDGLIIKGQKSLIGGEVESWNDHRIAMALAIASIKCKEKVKIKGYESVTKSYPHFFKDFKYLGGDIHGDNMGE